MDPTKCSLDKNDDNSLRSCVLEVDLEYRKVLHKLHNSYPVASSNVKNKKEMLSDYELSIIWLWYFCG